MGRLARCVGVALLLVGCIDDERPTVDARDTADTLLEVEVVEADTRDTTEQPDGPLEVEIEVEVVRPECNVDEDCALAITEACTRWFCNNQRCENAPALGVTCDDDDPCTGDGVCGADGCQQGTSIDCTAFHPQCWTAFSDVCDPGLGCAGIAAVEGEECDDGSGREPFSCVDGWNIPPDACDGAGMCIDTDGTIPRGIHPLVGEWFAVMQSTPADGDDAVARFMVDVRQTGAIVLDAVSSSDGEWKSALEGAPGQYCADADGRTQWTVGPEVISATSEGSRSVLLLRNDDRRAMGLAIRPSGAPSAVDGRYRVIVTSQHTIQYRSLTTRQGYVDYSNGCLSGGEIESPVGGPRITIAPVDDRSCLDANGPTVNTAVAMQFVGNTVTQVWFGAIGLGGDVVVLSAGDIGHTYFGLIILVRDRGDLPLPDLPGSWSFALHRNGYREPGGMTDIVFTHGTLELGTEFRSIGGNVFGDDGGLVLGGWWFTNVDGRYAQRATLGSELVHIAGVVARLDKLIVGWVVDGPADVTTPQALGPSPREGSLFFAVKTAPFY